MIDVLDGDVEGRSKVLLAAK